MSKFKYKRFGTTFRWTERYSRKILIKVLSLSLAVYLFILLINTLAITYKGTPADMQQLSLLRAIKSCSVAYLVWVIISGQWFCPNIKTKQQRITIKMLPATDLEKFLSHVAWLALQLIGMCIIFCMADLIRVALFAALGLDWIQWGIPVFFDNITTYVHFLDDKSPVYYMAGMAWLLWAQSLFALGSILFNRYNGIIISVIHVILFVAFITVMATSKNDMASLTKDVMIYIVLVIFTILAVFNWIMAYRLYSRMQVVNNKLINL